MSKAVAFKKLSQCFTFAKIYCFDKSVPTLLYENLIKYHSFNQSTISSSYSIFFILSFASFLLTPPLCVTAPLSFNFPLNAFLFFIIPVLPPSWHHCPPLILSLAIPSILSHYFPLLSPYSVYHYLKSMIFHLAYLPLFYSYVFQTVAFLIPFSPYSCLLLSIFPAALPFSLLLSYSYFIPPSFTHSLTPSLHPTLPVSVCHSVTPAFL